MVVVHCIPSSYNASHDNSHWRWLICTRANNYIGMKAMRWVVYICLYIFMYIYKCMYGCCCRCVRLVWIMYVSPARQSTYNTIVLYCVILYCIIVLYCIVLYCIV